MYQVQTAIDEQRESCQTFITGWTLLFCLFGFALCLHFSRVFFSLVLLDTPAVATVGDEAW